MADYASYERLKAQWIQEHPDATPEQYTKAILRIAKLCGV